MPEPVIIAAVRTAIGKKKGALAGVRADELLAHALRSVVEQAAIEGREVEDVIAGCVTQIGEQGFNIARTAALMAGFPVEVTGTSVNRQCGSSQQAFNFAAMSIWSGQQDVVIAAGVESMTRIPMGSDASASPHPFFPPSPLLSDKYPLVPQHFSAEMMAERWSITRRQCEEFSMESHRRAAAAIEKGWFKREITPIDVPADGAGAAAAGEGGQRKSFDTDEGVRPDTTLEKMATLTPIVKPDGVVTAATSSQISDGASAIVLASREWAERRGLKPRARVVATALAGVDPVLMLSGPIPATKKVLEKGKMRLQEIDLIEINEAFASVPLAWGKELDCDFGKVNVNGGAIALGHPLGSSGTRLLTTLLHELERRDQRYGLCTMCIGFGQATATIIDRRV
jgi:acetyl-CoA acyltransferase